jgi:hypothetical protein
MDKAITAVTIIIKTKISINLLKRIDVLLWPSAISPALPGVLTPSTSPVK